MALGGSTARRYAQAMFDIASDEKAVDRYRSSLERLANALDPGAIRVLRDPSAPLDQRLAGIDAVTGKEPEALRSLARLLVERDRIGRLRAIASAFGDLVDEREGVRKAKITTAVELDRGARDALVQRLERSTGKKIRATFAVDPRVLGGARVQIGDHLIDASLQNRLDALRAELAQ